MRYLQELNPFVFENQHFLLLETGYILPLANTQDMVKPILTIYDHYLFTKNKELPILLKNFLSLKPVIPVSDINFAELLLSNQHHLGQMEKNYPLSKSQRISMNYLSYQQAGEIFTIQGPPGTGKTSILLSVIASLWVEAALNKKMPPLIVATSTNNLAVTNILDSFNSTKNNANVTILEARWLPEISSFGAYLCSSIKENEANKKHYLYLLRDGSGTLTNFYKEEYKGAATSFFLKQFNIYFNKAENDLKNCQVFIHDQMLAKKNLLTKTITLLAQYPPIYEKILQYADNLSTFTQLIADYNEEIHQLEKNQQAIKKLRADWFAYKSRVFSKLLWWQWVPFIRKIMRDKVRVFTAKEHLFFDELLDHSDQVEHIFTTKLQALKLESKKQKLTELNAVKNAYEQFMAQKISLEKQIGHSISLDKLADYTHLEHINCQLDTSIRYQLFILASHYWEANWLLESAVLPTLDKSLSGREKYWRIHSMLVPCFVTTFYTGTSFFNYQAASKEFEPLQHFIDLLIIDEAGQALPALAGAMISIAKKALLVGDALQIVPVFKIPENIDLANAKKFHLCQDNLGYEQLKSFGILCSGNSNTSHSYGNLITIGQRMAKYHLQAQKLPGMLLLEHRRCPKDIISYCNELCYDNQLIPLTIEKESAFPRMGYAHIKGVEEKLGGSRCNKTEAVVIAAWIAKNKNKILSMFQQIHLTDCLAIITPFAAQKNEIQTALQRHDIYLDKVGTIHALQGSEKEIVIFSSVYTAENQQNFFFDKSPNMLNVAVSRAKRSFLVFGDMEIFDPSLNHPSSLLASYLFAAEVDNEITDICLPKLPQMIAKEVQSITTLKEHRDELIHAFSRAQQVLNIVSPYLVRNAIESDEIVRHITAHASRIVINIYTDPYLNQHHEYFEELLTLLTKAGANLLLAERIHSKIIAIDENVIIIGSFNWLSASRNNPHYIREETSLIYRGPQVSKIIETTLKPIRDKIKKEVKSKAKSVSIELS